MLIERVISPLSSVVGAEAQIKSESTTICILRREARAYNVYKTQTEHNMMYSLLVTSVDEWKEMGKSTK